MLVAVAAPAHAQWAERPTSGIDLDKWMGGSEQPLALLDRAEAERKKSHWPEAARLALAAQRKGASLERVDRLMRDVAPHLTMAEAACLRAWFGRRPDLEYRFARAALDAGRKAEAVAQALALLSLDPSGPYAKDTAKLLQQAGRVSSADTVHIAPGATQSVFQIAVLVPQSGDYEAYGRSLLAGFEIALGLSGGSKPVQLVAFDTQGEGWRAAADGRHALDAGAGLLVGDVLTIPTLVLAGLSAGAGIPLLSPSATDESIGRASPIVFQTGASAEAQARTLAYHAIREGKHRIIAVPASLSPSFLDPFEAEVRKLGASVVRVPAAAGMRDFRATAGFIRSARADAVLLPFEPEQAELWVAGLVREKTLMPLLGTEAIDPEGFHAETRKSLEGMTAVSLDYALPEAVFDRVDTLAKQHYHLSADRFVRRGYLTGRVIASALAGGADSPTTLAAALRRRSGALGFVRYEDSEAFLPILVVRKGQFARIH